MISKHYIWSVCWDCIKRNCNKAPVRVKDGKASATPMWTCPFYKKHVEGFQLEEVITNGEKATMQQMPLGNRK